MNAEVLTLQSDGPETTRALAGKILEACEADRIFAFYGDLGAGKTTLIQALCEELGVEDNVKSPTFSIINEYESENGELYHFDFYRIKEVREVFDIGFEEYLDSGAYCFMEWPERIGSLLPAEAVEIRITAQGPLQREIEITRK